MKILRLLAAFALTLAFALPTAQAKDWKKVVIATEGAYMPFNGHSPDGKLIGFEIDLGNNLCERMKITCEFVAQDWDGIIPGLTAGKYDAIMDGMSITAKRQEVIDFSRNYSRTPTTFAVEKKGPLANLPDTGTAVSLDDKAAMDAAVQALTPGLKGKVIGVQIATIQADLLNTYFKGIADIRTYKTSTSRPAVSMRCSPPPPTSSQRYRSPAVTNSNSPARCSPAACSAKAPALASASPTPTCVTCSTPRYKQPSPTAR
jgi:octopine/nopaline transport system substrate-binding protein